MKRVHFSFQDAPQFETAARMVDYILKLCSRAVDEVANQVKTGINRFRGIKALDEIQPLLDRDPKMRCMEVDDRPDRLTIEFALDFTKEKEPVMIGGQIRIVGLGLRITQWRSS